MESQKVAGILGTIVAAIVLGAAFYFVPRNAQLMPGAMLATAPVAANEKPLQRGPVVQDITPGAPVVRGPVVRDVPQ
jgi:hypothetical protein